MMNYLYNLLDKFRTYLWKKSMLKQYNISLKSLKYSLLANKERNMHFSKRRDPETIEEYTEHILDVAGKVKEYPSSVLNSKHNLPPIIGLWTCFARQKPRRQFALYDIVNLSRESGKRNDTENEYFSKTFHYLNDYVDENWDQNKKDKVIKYLVTNVKSINNSIVIKSPIDNMEDTVFSDGKYMWCSSLPLLMIENNIKPPQFFIDYILNNEN